MKKSYKILSSVFICVLLLFSLVTLPIDKVLAKSELTIEENINNVKSCFLIDTKSGTVIYEKEADKKLPIASMTKLVTLGVVFDAIDNGKIQIDKEITISATAAAAEGSEAFLDANKRYKIEDLIKTVIISSANDSAIALAEAVAGSEQNFARLMNDYAESIGMENSHFSNATGLPSTDHYSTARDMSIIYKNISDNFIYKKYAKIWIDELVHSNGRKTGLVNTNRLVKSYSSCTGGKTGHTNEAGYCLTAAAKRGEMELIGVVVGAKDSKIRFSSMINLFDYGFDNFENRVVVKKDNPICKINIKGSKDKLFDVYAKNDYIKFIKKGDELIYSTEIILKDVVAPINSDEKVGSLLILDKNNIVVEEIDLVLNQKVEKIKLNEILENIYNEW